MLFQGEVKPHSCNQTSTLSNSAEIVENESSYKLSPLRWSNFVFEWLEWNGTNKNDWFFVLWWGLVVVWFLNGSISLYQRLKK
jgi:hypothetical protein